jgi:hypothetical protein
MTPTTDPTNNTKVFPEGTRTLPGSSQPSDDGWGRRRDGTAPPPPNKTKGSWQFARRSLAHNIEIDPRYATPYRPPPQPASQPSQPASQPASQPSPNALVEDVDDAAVATEATTKMHDGEKK